MTDEPTPEPPDQRDDRVAELLDVPPLDDVTRRRLVTRALEALPGSPSQARAPAGDEADAGERTGAPASAGPRGRRILAAAAAVVAVVAVGAGVFSAVRDDDGSGTTSVAGRVEKRSAGGGGAEAPDQSTQEAPTGPAAPQASSVVAPIQLGDLGDVTDANRLRGAVQGGLSGGQRRENELLDAQATPCLGARLAGTAPLAVGTGRYQGAPVVVVVVAENLDRFRVSLLDPVTCAATLELAV